MSAGFIVIPFGDVATDALDLRDLASELQAVIAERVGIPDVLPLASHWIEHPIMVERIASHLHERGHSFPNCQVCP